MIIKNFRSGLLHNNNYLVYDEESKEALLIDCTEENTQISNFIDENNLHLKYILLTHGHFDHFLGIDFFRKKYSVEAFLHEKDAPLLPNINLFLDLVNLPHRCPPKITQFFNKTNIFTLGKEKVKIYETPGHSPGGSCFLIQDSLFSGDTLFRNTHGRTDFFGCDDRQMQKSLKLLVENLPEDVKVFPGHGSPTTIGQEKSLYSF